MGCRGATPAKTRRRDVPVEAEFRSVVLPSRGYRKCLTFTPRASLGMMRSRSRNATFESGNTGDIRFDDEAWGAW
jgi:hypothetical protein